MRVIFKRILLVLLFFTATVSAQKKVWLDAGLKETTTVNGVYYSDDIQNKKMVTYFYKSGKIYKTIPYNEGKISGVYNEYYQTGSLKTTGKYENGLQEGVWKTYYSNGKIKEKGKYTKGEKVGVWKSFYKNI
mgnify:CR=1 FL=1